MQLCDACQSLLQRIAAPEPAEEVEVSWGALRGTTALYKAEALLQLAELEVVSRGGGEA